MPEGEEDMNKLSKTREILAMGGSLVSYLNFIGIILGVIIGATWYIKNRENTDQNQSEQIASVILQVKQSAEQTNKQLDEFKRDQGQKVDTLSSDFKLGMADAKAQLAAAALQIQTMQNSNTALSGRVDLVDQKVTQAGMQLDRIERSQPSWESRLAAVETGLSVIKALFEQEKPRK